MEYYALVVQRFAGVAAQTFLAGAQSPKVVACARCSSSIQLEYDASNWQAAQADVEETAHLLLLTAGDGYCDRQRFLVDDSGFLSCRRRRRWTIGISVRGGGRVNGHDLCIVELCRVVLVGLIDIIRSTDANRGEWRFFNICQM